MTTIPQIPDPIPSCSELRAKYHKAAMLFALCYPRQEQGADQVLAFEQRQTAMREARTAAAEKIRRGEALWVKVKPNRYELIDLPIPPHLKGKPTMKSIWE